MYVTESSLTFSSTHRLLTQATRRETVRAWIGSQPPADRGLSAPRAHDARPTGDKAAKTAGTSEEMDDLKLPAKLGFLKAFLERFFGIRVRICADPASGCAGTTGAARQAETGAETASPRNGWGVEVTTEESRYESEATTFQASGTVRTADGRTVRFRVDLSMQREFFETSRTSLRAGDAATDPLVLNFDGTAAELVDTPFRFDLDADGQEEAIPSLAPGSGFLAFDRNADGVVNDGSELFGPTSGDGFAELAQYDADRNRWIDEADPVFSRLRLWEMGADGNGTLTPLLERNVGAIALDRAETPFTVTDAANRSLGQILASGIYLGEDGSAGTVQQMNLVV